MSRSLPVLSDTRHRDTLRGDCARCAALCCVALAFDRGPEFAFDKAADERCRHLGASQRCLVHASRSTRGLAGCISYDCFGAGQYVSERLFPEALHGAAGELSPRMLEAFRSLRRVHELRFLLHEAARFEAGAPERHELLARLEPEGGLTLRALEALNLSAIEREVSDFLRRLAGVDS